MPSHELPLSRYRLVSTSSRDEAADILSRNLMPLTIAHSADAQQFQLDMNGVRLGRFFLGFNQFGADTVVKPEIVHDAVALAVGHDERHPNYIEVNDERIRVSPTSAALSSPGSTIRNIRPANAGMFAFTIPISVLSDQIAQISGKSFNGRVLFDPTIDLTKGVGRSFIELTRAITSELEGGVENRLLRPLLQDALISTILALPGNVSRLIDEGRRVPDAGPYVLARAEEYLDAHVQEPISMSDLVSYCGCSRSSLYDVFKSVRGYTPMQFLLSQRLELAHRRIMENDSGTTTSIAHECGFSHYGRFAAAYQKRFDEKPSATRRRAGIRSK